jgi:hypothetical protein
LFNISDTIHMMMIFHFLYIRQGDVDFCGVKKSLSSKIETSKRNILLLYRMSIRKINCGKFSLY